VNSSYLASIIEELDIIEKFLCHLWLWNIRNHDPPCSTSSNNIPELVYDYSDSQIPAFFITAL
jgi:hypothetical protein